MIPALNTIKKKNLLIIKDSLIVVSLEIILLLPFIYTKST